MIPVFPDTKVALKGKKGLIVGIANDQSIAWGCAKAFRALGADLAVTYLNERAKKHVEPLAQALEAPIFMPMDVMVEGQTEQVFERIGKEWGQLDFLLHSIAFSPKEALHGRVVDVGRDGFLKTTVYLADMDDFAAVEAIAGQFFPHDPPALTLLQPSGLSMPGARVQVDAVLLSSG